MRNLTLGVVVICGGVLAALPFRRSYDVDVTANSAKSDFSSPQGSDGGSSAVDLVTADTASSDRVASDMIVEISKTTSPISEQSITEELQKEIDDGYAVSTQKRSFQNDSFFANEQTNIYSWNTPHEYRPAKRSRPLTYDDLAVPLDQPALLDERFPNADVVKSNLSGASIPAEQQQRLRSTELVVNSDDSVVRQPETRLRSSTADDERQNAELASASGDQFNSAPQTNGDSRSSGRSTANPSAIDIKRHWIRQPD